MSVLTDWLQTGWLAFAALAFLWAETLLLCLLSRDPKGRFRMLVGGAVAGSCLMAALGLALRGEAHEWILALLTLSLIGHLIDVASRLRA